MYTCPYCQKHKANTPGALANHKTTCSEKRFLGGQLTIETWNPNKESIDSFIQKER